MKRDYLTYYSNYLNRDMHTLVYGHTGVPLIAFPCQDGMCDNWEGFQMPETLSDYIESGRIQVFVVDTVDTESWSDFGGDKGHRAWMQENYYHYIVDEAVPFFRSYNGTGELPIVTGFSMGANHAAIVFFRRPELFGGMLSLSGVYSAQHFFGDWMNGTLYDNSPIDFLENMSPDHPFINIYNSRPIIFCVGQGAWEDQGISTLRRFEYNMNSKGIHAWVDYWGYDCNHDWPWWRKQIRYFLPYLLRDC